MLVFGEFGIMLGCTLGGVRGDCDGDRIRSRVLGTSSELHGGRDATRLWGARDDSILSAKLIRIAPETSSF